MRNESSVHQYVSNHLEKAQKNKGLIFVSMKNTERMRLFSFDFCFHNADFTISIDKSHKEMSEYKENNQSSLILWKRGCQNRIWKRWDILQNFFKSPNFAMDSSEDSHPHMGDCH